MLNILSALGLGFLAPTTARADRYEAPQHSVLAEHDGWELRAYAPAIEARVTVGGDFDTAVSRGFRVLASYIFGGNARDEKIAMTVPVAAWPDGAPPDVGPRVTRPDGVSRWTVSFTMPSSYTLASLPPTPDARVELVELPPEHRAVRPFSGWIRTSAVDREIAALRASLQAEGLQAMGPPVVAQYDQPWIPGPFRHNEIQIAVAPASTR